MMSPDSRQMLSAWTSLHRASNLAQRGPARRRMVTCWALWQLGARTSADKNEQYMSSYDICTANMINYDRILLITICNSFSCIGCHDVPFQSCW